MKHAIRDWDEFREDAIYEANLMGHPAAEEAYALAWKTGHEGGPDEVKAHLKDIAKILLEDKRVKVSKKK